MEEENNEKVEFEFTKPKSNYKLLRQIYRKNYLKQHALEYLLSIDYRESGSWVNREYIRDYIRNFYTKDLYWSTPVALLDVCLNELHQLNLIKVLVKENIVFYQITHDGKEILKTFNIQNTAATTFSNFSIYRLTIWTIAIAILALVISIIAIIIKV